MEETLVSISGYVNKSPAEVTLWEVTSSLGNNSCNQTLPSIAEIGVPGVILGIIFGFIIMLAVVGNLLVIVSVLRTKNLRRQKAYFFVVSLAVADLLVAAVAMMFNCVTTVMQGRWIFDMWVCDMYNAMDVVFSTASILNLFCISLYRWFQIVRAPESYREYFTRSVVVLIIVLIWVVSFILAFVPILTYVYTTEEHINNRDPCKCEFVVNLWYAIVSSSISFWLPSAGIIYFYYQITKCALQKARADAIVRRSTYSAGAITQNCSINGSTGSAAQGSRRHDSVLLAEQALLDPLMAQTGGGNSLSRSSNFSSPNSSTLPRPQATSPAPDNRNENLKDNINAAKTLIIIIVVFFACWFPFFFTYTLGTILSVFKIWDFPEHWIKFVFWLGYCNSSINPFIYAVKFKEFQKPLKDTLICMTTCGRKEQSCFTSHAEWTATSDSVYYRDNKMYERARNNAAHEGRSSISKTNAV